MEIKRSTTQFSYRIEQKPDGGYVAHPSDPSMETLEAATQEEIEEKMKAKINALLGQQILGEFHFGGVNIAVNKKINISTQVGTGKPADVVLGDGSPPPQLPSGYQQEQLPPGYQQGKSSGMIWVFIAGLIIGAVVIYFLFARH